MKDKHTAQTLRSESFDQKFPTPYYGIRNKGTELNDYTKEDIGIIRMLYCSCVRTK